MNPSPHGIKSEAYAPVRMGAMGAVVANHPLAAMAGMKVLHKGGNAVDAAVGVAFALGVAEPAGSTIGGDGFVMVYMKHGAPLKNGKRNGSRPRSVPARAALADAPSGGVGSPVIEVVNGTGAAPLAATPERYKDGIPSYGMLSVSVPGIVDALLAAHTRHGTLSLSECIEPAIELCEEGVPVTYYSHQLAAPHPLLNSFPASAKIFAPQGHPLRPGEVRRNPDLARTYRTIAEEGRDAFYEGKIAEAIVRFSAGNGGIMTMEDFRRHRAQWQSPISTTYRGHTVYEAPPNSSGHVLLQMLSMVERFDLSSLGHDSPERLHLLVEAKRLAFADREAYLADPEFTDVPVDGLLSKEYAAARSALIGPERAAAQVSEGDPWEFMGRGPDRAKTFYTRQTGLVRPGDRPGVTRRRQKVGAKESDTTHFCVVDRWGNAVGELQSIQMAYGSGMVAGTTGILLNNRMTYWHLDPDHIDCLRPGQRVRHTMNPVMVFNGAADGDGKLELVCGTPGADTQVQSNLQVISAVFDHGFTVSEALHAPRWTHYQGRTGSGYPHAERNALEIEDRAGEDTLAGMKRRGHPVQAIGAWAGPGSEGAIRVHPESCALMAAGDPRRDGQALVW